MTQPPSGSEYPLADAEARPDCPECGAPDVLIDRTTMMGAKFGCANEDCPRATEEARDAAATNRHALRKASLPCGVTVYQKDQFLVREKVVYGDGEATFTPGDVFRIERLEFAMGDIQIELNDAPLDWLAFEALNSHLTAGEFVLTDINTDQ